MLKGQNKIPCWQCWTVL